MSDRAKALRPTRDQLAGAVGRRISDVIAPDLRVLFCGINPGLYSGAVGHHFARPGNRFWPALHGAGFTPRLLSPFQERELLDYGLGITNIVNRTTAAAAELSKEELRAGAKRLRAKVRRFRPRWLAVLGIGTYRDAFGRPHARLGPQEQTLGDTKIWLLPNPSGLNAHYQMPDFIKFLRDLRDAAEE